MIRLFSRDFYTRFFSFHKIHDSFVSREFWRTFHFTWFLHTIILFTHDSFIFTWILTHESFNFMWFLNTNLFFSHDTWFIYFHIIDDSHEFGHIDHSFSRDFFTRFFSFHMIHDPFIFKWIDTRIISFHVIFFTHNSFITRYMIHLFPREFWRTNHFISCDFYTRFLYFHDSFIFKWFSTWTTLFTSFLHPILFHIWFFTHDSFIFTWFSIHESFSFTWFFYFRVIHFFYMIYSFSHLNFEMNHIASWLIHFHMTLSFFHLILLFFLLDSFIFPAFLGHAPDSPQAWQG